MHRFEQRIHAATILHQARPGDILRTNMTSSTPPVPQTPPVTPRSLVPVALLFLIGALWGSFFVLIKIAVTDGVRPVSYLFWFTLLSGGWLFLAGMIRGKRPKFARADLPYYLKLGLVRFTLANMILYTVQGKLAVGIMAVIMAFVPIFTYLISLLVRIEKFLWLRATGILIGFAGVLLIVLPKSSLPDRVTGNLGADRVRSTAVARHRLCRIIGKIPSEKRQFDNAFERNPVCRSFFCAPAGSRPWRIPNAGMAALDR